MEDYKIMYITLNASWNKYMYNLLVRIPSHLLVVGYFICHEIMLFVIYDTQPIIKDIIV
jgi:hypothetical protein